MYFYRNGSIIVDATITGLPNVGVGELEADIVSALTNHDFNVSGLLFDVNRLFIKGEPVSILWFDTINSVLAGVNCHDM